MPKKKKKGDSNGERASLRGRKLHMIRSLPVHTRRGRCKLSVGQCQVSSTSVTRSAHIAPSDYNSRTISPLIKIALPFCPSLQTKPPCEQKESKQPAIFTPRAYYTSPPESQSTRKSTTYTRPGFCADFLFVLLSSSDCDCGKSN